MRERTGGVGERPHRSTAHPKNTSHLRISLVNDLQVLDECLESRGFIRGRVGAAEVFLEALEQALLRGHVRGVEGCLCAEQAGGREEKRVLVHDAVL